VSEPPEKLIPARRDDLIATLAFAVTRDSRLARMQSAELLASIVAERIVDRLEASGYVVMRGPPAPGAGGDRPRLRGPMILRWLRRRQDARRLAHADAEALIHDHGAEACREARERERERDVSLTEDGNSRRADAGAGRSRLLLTPATLSAMQRAGSWVTPKLPLSIANPRRHA
jgi:hypothetical protein